MLLDAGVFINVASGNHITMALMQSAASKALFFIAGHSFAEFYRGGRRTAREALLVKQWRPEVVAIGSDEGKFAGELLAATRRDNTMDALVVSTAIMHRMDEILTSDPDDLEQLRAVHPSAATLTIVDVN